MPHRVAKSCTSGFLVLQWFLGDSFADSILFYLKVYTKENMMKTDITLRVTAKLQQDAEQNLKKASSGHIGTHFDCMNKQFPLENTERRGVVFDVSAVSGRDIEKFDVDMSRIKRVASLP